MGSNMSVVEGTGDQLTTDVKQGQVVTDLKEDETEEKEIRKPSPSEDAFSGYLIEFAKRNYPKVMGPNLKSIKIKGMYYTLTEIVEEVEDEFARLEKEMNTPVLDSKDRRERLYAFLTFACSIQREQLKFVDRGELKLIATIIGLMQNGFRDL